MRITLYYSRPALRPGQWRGRPPEYWKTLALGLLALILGYFPAIESLAGSSGDVRDRGNISKFIADLESLDSARRKKATAALKALSESAGKQDDTRRPVSLALLEGIGDEKLTVDARVTLLRVLPAVGRYESVRPVAKLLSTTKNVRLRDASRAALEAIPVVTAVKPLRDAMKTATGDFRVALVRSLGKRQDSLSVGLLLALTTSDERPLRLAVIAALAEIGDRSAHDVIESAVATATPEDRDAILTSYTRYAWRLGETAEGGASRRVFLKLTHMEKKWRVAGIEGLARAGIRKEAPLLLAFLDHADESTRLAARDALKKLRGSAQAIATIAVNSKTPVERRRELIDVLAARKDVAGVAQLIVQAASDASASVRESSARALARLDVKTAGSQLIALLADGEASVREATSKALAVWNVDGARAFLESQRDTTTSDDVRRSLTLILERRKD